MVYKICMFIRRISHTINKIYQKPNFIGPNSIVRREKGTWYCMKARWITCSPIYLLLID